MHEYEIFIEDINPCGGEQYSKKTLIEAEAVFTKKAPSVFSHYYHSRIRF